MRGLSVFFEQTIYQREKDNRDLKLGLWFFHVISIIPQIFPFLVELCIEMNHE